MMASEGSGLEIIEKLTEWPSEKVRCHLDVVLPSLISCLTNDDKGNVLPAVHALLVICLPSVPLVTVERDVLQHAMPAARQLFGESLKGIKLRISDGSHSDDDILDTLSSLLQVCVELLKCMDSVLKYIASQGNVTINDVASVPSTVAAVMFETFRHCKESEILYGTAFSGLADILGMLFRQCYQVQIHFFEVMTLHVLFDCSVEGTVVLLVEILQVLCKIGEQVSGLDVKSMAEHWKGFARILQQHLEPLKQRLDISYPLCYLSQEVEKKIIQLVEPDFMADSKLTLKHLKTTSFILKIIVKLCEQFGSGSNALGNCYANLLQLLLCLHRHSPVSPALQALDSDFVGEIERHLTIAADPLLIHLINESEFRMEYFKKIREIHKCSDDSLPALLLTIAIMKRLLHCNPDQREMWLEKAETGNVIASLLQCTKYSHLELSSEVSLQAVVRSGQPPRHCDLYEALVCHSAALAMSVSSDRFSSVESILLDAVVDSHLWPGMMATDIWCICLRACTAEYTLEIALYLADIVISLSVHIIKRRQDFKQISIFLRRTFSLLGDRGKQTFVENYPFLKYPSLWKIIGLNNLPKALQEVSEQCFLPNSILCLSAFFDNPFKVSNLKDMFYSLYGLSACLEWSSARCSWTNNQYDDVLNYIIRLWEFSVVDTGSESLPSCDGWRSSLVEALCTCTQHLVHKMTNTQILEMLYHVQKIVNGSSSTMKLSSLKVLRGLASKILDESPDQSKICSVIALLFNKLLKESNSLLRECALETFEYFAVCTAHESILSDAVSGNEMVRDLVAQFLKKEAPSSSSTPLNFSDYLRHQREHFFVHHCKEEKIRALSPQPEQKPLKKIRYEVSNDLSSFLEDDLLDELLEKDMSDVLSRICDDSHMLVSSCSFGKIPVELQLRLKNVVELLNEFVK